MPEPTPDVELPTLKSLLKEDHNIQELIDDEEKVKSLHRILTINLSEKPHVDTWTELSTHLLRNYGELWSQFILGSLAKPFFDQIESTKKDIPNTIYEFCKSIYDTYGRQGSRAFNIMTRPHDWAYADFDVGVISNLPVASLYARKWNYETVSLQGPLGSMIKLINIFYTNLQVGKVDLSMVKAGLLENKERVEKIIKTIDEIEEQ